MKKRLVRLTESDLKRIIKRSVGRVLREHMYDNPLNRTDLDGSEVEDEEGLTPEVGTDEYDPGIDDLDMNGPDDNIEGFKSPFYGLRGYMDNDEEFLDNATYDPDFDYFDTDVDNIPVDDYENYIQKNNESRRRYGRRLTESDLRNIVRKSVNRVLRESDFNDIDAEGLYNSLKTYNENPVNINRDVDYDPSDEEIMNAMNDIDLDTDFSDLMSGQYDESRRRMGRIIRESIRKVLRENDDEWRESYRDDKGNIFQSKGRGSKKQWRTLRDNKKGTQPKAEKYTGNEWREAYRDDKGNRIQSKGHGPNKQFRTIKSDNK